MAFKMKGFRAYSPMKQADDDYLNKYLNPDSSGPTDKTSTTVIDLDHPLSTHEGGRTNPTPIDNTATVDNTTVVNDTEQNTSTTTPKYKGLLEELNAARKANKKYRKEGFFGKIQDKFQLGEKGIWGDKYQEKKQQKKDSYRLDKSIRSEEEDRYINTPIEEGGARPKKLTQAELRELRKSDSKDWVVVGKIGTGIHPARMTDRDGNPIHRTTWREGYQQRHYYVVPKEAYWTSEKLQKMRNVYTSGRTGKQKSYIEKDFGSEYILDNPLD